MRHKMLIFLIFFLPTTLFCQEIENPLNKLKYSEGILQRVDKGEVISFSTVNYDVEKKLQSFVAYGLGFHKRNCQLAMRKISAYENFPNYLSIINKSTYDEKQKLLNLQVSPPILSYDIDVFIKVERIKNQGIYPFQFTSGFFTALKGQIELVDYKGRCLFHVTSNWAGPYSDIPSPILKLFLEAIIKMGMENFFRVSS